MARVSFFIDGFNVYHALNEIVIAPQAPNRKIRKYRKFLWLDYIAFARRFLRGQDTLADVFYFTAYAHWLINAPKRHGIYISALQDSGAKVVLGKFYKKDDFCRACNNRYVRHEEKQSDVNLAIHLLKEAVQDTYDQAWVVSADTDIIPAIKTVKSMYPLKRVGVIFPLKRTSYELKQSADFFRYSEVADYSQCQLLESYTTKKGIVLKKPVEWK